MKQQPKNSFQKSCFSKRNFHTIKQSSIHDQILSNRRPYCAFSRGKQLQLSISQPDLRSSTWITHSTLEVTLSHKLHRVELISYNSKKFYKSQDWVDQQNLRRISLTKHWWRHVFCRIDDRWSLNGLDEGQQDVWEISTMEEMIFKSALKPQEESIILVPKVLVGY